MRKLLLNERGSLGIALAVIVVVFLSSVTISSVAFRDVVASRIQQDALQEHHFLRSDGDLGFRTCQITGYDGGGFTIPTRQIAVTSGSSRTSYFLKSKIAVANVATFGGLYSTNGFTVKTLVTAKRGAGSGALYSRNQSPVVKYGEKDIRRSTFAGYHYFSDKDESENINFSPEAGRVYFYGYDLIHGKVHSNSDIWIKQYGPNNSGWPTFYNQVTTCGQIQSASGTPPYATIFLQGYFEHSSYIEFDATANAIWAHGIRYGVPDDAENTIYYVISNGASQTIYKGKVSARGRDSIAVYADYPPATPPMLFWYRIPHKDTIWQTVGSVNVNNTSVMFYGQLWLQGVFSGKQTWASADTIYITDNIKLNGTALGTNPDGNLNPANMNTSDFVGIVSEQMIMIKYGFRSPVDSLRHRYGCADGTDDGIYIYGALCALGNYPDNPHKDGMFTFEYQHPHPSTPDMRIGNRVYNKIDLHLNLYPQTPADTWPGDLDMPWYNPLWPEAQPYMERGKIHLYGSVAQRRRGFVHRSPNDPPNHDTGLWDGPNYKYGLICQGVNAPGASGSGVGYEKDYNFDNRLSFTQPPDFPETHVRAGLTPFESENWRFLKPPSNF